VRLASLVPFNPVGPEFLVAGAMVAALGLGVTAVALYLPGAMTGAALDSAYRGNIDAVDQIKLTRGYYTRYVVAKALKSGALAPTYKHKDDPHAIPLPATFVQDISDLLKQEDTSFSMVSPYPWPHRAGRKMDNFQSSAWDAFQKDSSAVFSRQEIRDGRRVLRVAVADKMTAATCVSCHNSDPESPKKDWKLGDVRAVMEVTKVVEPYLAAAERRSEMITWALALPALALSVLVFVVAGFFARYNRIKREADLHVRYLAHHDAMTGALNRARFLDLLSGALKSGAGHLAVHYIDLDGFKEINDRLGHGVGDELIKKAAERLKGILTGNDILARLGGDEFAIAQIGLTRAHDAEAGAARIVEVLSQPFQLEHHRLWISASVGTTSSSDTSETSERILAKADTALYQAKSDGRNRYVIFSPSMQDKLQGRRDLETLVHEAVASGALELHFQPLYDVDLQLAGFEALVRLSDGRGGLIPPMKFIPVAEEVGAIQAIGGWVIREACEVAASLPSHLTIAVNLSPAQFLGRGSVTEIVRTALDAAGLAAHRLELEITEGLLLEASEDVVEELLDLKQLGTSIVMDDFGTGHSSLGYLWKLPFDKLKIDRSFIAAPLEARATISPILDTIIALGRTLNMKVTAEGIETREQAEFFRNLNCDYLQGYYFGRPVPKTELASVILRDFRSAATLDSAPRARLGAVRA
jgi:diguanylate cyclase (GGDEF)-like protein